MLKAMALPLNFKVSLWVCCLGIGSSPFLIYSYIILACEKQTCVGGVAQKSATTICATTLLLL